MDGVERVMVLGIFAVIVAILSIAAWGVTSDDGPAVADDGGVAAGPSIPAVVGGNKSSVRIPEGRVTDPDRARKAHEQALKALRGGAKEPSKGTQEPFKGLPSAGPVSDIAVAEPTPRTGRRSDLTATESSRPPLKSQQSVVDEAGRPSDRATSSATGNKRYTVREGDTLWRIARNQVGEGDTARIVERIQELNPTIDATALTVGQMLVLPAKLPEGVLSVSLEEQARKNGARIHTVQEGDTLHAIASKHLGKSDRWEEIYRLNANRISDPERIRVGMRILIPGS